MAIEARGGRKVLAGTVFDGQPRIVRMRDLKIEFTPEGYILVLAYEDRPGVVGAIGTLLGRRNVNIAAMHVGRRVRRGRAIVVLILDEDLTPEHLDEVDPSHRRRLRPPHPDLNARGGFTQAPRRLSTTRWASNSSATRLSLSRSASASTSARSRTPMSA